MTHPTTVTAIPNTTSNDPNAASIGLPSLTIGIDLGDRHSGLCAIDASGGKIPRQLRPALVPILRTIAELTTRIRKLEHRIERICTERYPETTRLRQVDGVGAITSLTFVLTIEDPTRFAKSRTVGAFLGLRPKRNQSGKSDPEMHITKAGDSDLRRLLVQSAQYILGPFGVDCDLRRFGLAMAARGRKSAKRRALVAVARKLAVLLHRLWLSGQDYDPLRHAEGRNPRRRPRA